MVVIAGLDYPSAFIPAGLIAILVLSLVRRVKNSRDSGRWLLITAGDDVSLVDAGGSRAVSCTFPYVTSWLVVARAQCQQTGARQWLPFLAPGLSRDQWRRLHRFVRDGERSRPGRRN